MVKIASYWRSSEPEFLEIINWDKYWPGKGIRIHLTCFELLFYGNWNIRGFTIKCFHEFYRIINYSQSWYYPSTMFGESNRGKEENVFKNLQVWLNKKVSCRHCTHRSCYSWDIRTGSWDVANSYRKYHMQNVDFYII